MIKKIKELFVNFDRLIPKLYENLSSSYILYFFLAATQFILIPFYIKYLGLSKFGQLMFMFGLVNFASIGTSFLSGSVVRILGEYNAKENHKFFNHTFILSKYIFVIYSIFFLVSLYFLWKFLLQINFVEFSIANNFFLFCIYFILYYEQLVERQCLHVLNKIKSLNYIEISKTLVLFLGIILLLPIYQNEQIIWFVLIFSLIFQRLLFYIYFYLNKLPISIVNLKINLSKIFKRLFGKIGIGYGAYGIINIVYISDIILIGILMGPDAVSKFIIIWKIPETICLIISRFPSVLEPTIIKNDINNKIANKTLFSNINTYYILIIFILSAAYSLFGMPLSYIWLGELYSDNLSDYILCSIAMFFISVNKLPVTFLYSLIKFKQLIRISFIELIIKIFIILLTIEYLQVNSILLGIIGSSILYSFYQYRKSVLNIFKKLN